MLKSKRLARLLARYCVSKLKAIPYVLNIEVTQRCNARCKHCTCWQDEPRKELLDYADIVMSFRPLVVWLSGGEPLIREDIVQIVKNIREKDPYIYMGMATNGWLLNSGLCRQLSEAGLDQVNISLDFIGTQHDEYRQIDGLFNHIANNITDIASQGLCVVLTVCILRENLDWLLRIAELAKIWGVEVGYSCYSAQKTGDQYKCVPKEQISQLRQIVDSLCRWKKEHGVIKSSNSYLRKIPEFFEAGSIGGCQATKTWLYVAPDGFLKICPDKQIFAHYKDYTGSLSIDCGECWYTCRGEMETSIFERLTSEIWNGRWKNRGKVYVRLEQ